MKDSLQNKFETFVAANNLFQKTNVLLLAVSGGVDSVVLCHLCKQAGINFEIAHCNFQLRDTESERDEAFVKTLGEQFEVKVHIKKFDTEKYAAENKTSIQVAARELRYRWFYELLAANTDHNGLLATAHHADDNIETVLMNFFKGTGISGLHGILPKKERIVRPLLFADKEELLQYAKENDLGWVEDSSNAADKYTRNFFRHHVIPLVEQVIPKASENVLHTIELMKEAEQLYHQAIEIHKKKLLEQKGNEVHIPVRKLAKVQPLKTIAYEIIKEYGFTGSQVDDLVTLLKSETGKYIASATHRIIKNRNWLIVAPLQSAESSTILIEEDDKKIAFEGGQLNIQLSAFDAQSPISKESSKAATLDAKHIKFPLLLRKWKQGDYFYPLGMPKKKKVARFLIDQKLSKTAKEKVWVIESNKKIIWIVGYRIDDRFKITASTKKILKISIT